MIELTPAQRKEHRAAAHHLGPGGMIGNDGLSAAVKKETDAALRSHGLIKVRVLSDDRQARQTMLEALAVHGAELPPLAPTAFVPLPALIVNLPSEGNTRFLRFTGQVEVVPLGRGGVFDASGHEYAALMVFNSAVPATPGDCTDENYQIEVSAAGGPAAAVQYRVDGAHFQTPGG